MTDIEIAEKWGKSFPATNDFLGVADSGLYDLATRESFPEGSLKAACLEGPKDLHQCSDGTAASPSMGRRDCIGNPSKAMFQLIPPESEEAIARVMTYGLKKYEPRNWEKGLPWSEIVGSLRRHLNAFLQGEQLDSESGLPHVWHLHANSAMLVAMVGRRPDLNDLPRIQHRES